MLRVKWSENIDLVPELSLLLFPSSRVYQTPFRDIDCVRSDRASRSAVLDLSRGTAPRRELAIRAPRASPPPAPSRRSPAASSPNGPATQIPVSELGSAPPPASSYARAPPSRAPSADGRARTSQRFLPLDRVQSALAASSLPSCERLEVVVRHPQRKDQAGQQPERRGNAIAAEVRLAAAIVAVPEVLDSDRSRRSARPPLARPPSHELARDPAATPGRRPPMPRRHMGVPRGPRTPSRSSSMRRAQMLTDASPRVHESSSTRGGVDTSAPRKKSAVRPSADA